MCACNMRRGWGSVLGSKTNAAQHQHSSLWLAIVNLGVQFMGLVERLTHLGNPQAISDGIDQLTRGVEDFTGTQKQP